MYDFCYTLIILFSDYTDVHDLSSRRTWHEYTNYNIVYMGYLINGRFFFVRCMLNPITAFRVRYIGRPHACL